MKKIVIVGAGPCGILLAHYLLQRDAQYQIEVYERRNDPRQVPLYNSKTIPYGINERGLIPLRRIKGLEEAIKAQCVKNYGLIVHQKNCKTRVFPKKQPTFNTDRISVVMTLLSKLMEKSENGKVKLHFNCKCSHLDFHNKTVTFEKIKETASKEAFTVNYDLLIGADGARSVVRRHLLNTDFFEFEQKYVHACYKTVFLPGSNEKTGIKLKSDCLHVWRPEEGITFGAVPQLNGTFIGLLFFPKNEKKVVGLSSTAEVMDFFHQNMPEVGQLLSEAEAAAFLKRPISTQLKTRCNRYHYGDSVLIMGDAAHAVSSSLGQGCNNAFEDVMVFDSLLDEYADEWAAAVEQFTIRRQPDAYALWELDTNVFPASKTLFLEFMVRESFAKIMNKLFPQFFLPPLREVLSTTALSYAEILKSYQGWISKVKKSNEKLFSLKE
ncbi:MAG TPA: FAD-dependent monooxygenase [Cyanobacteria bacterium UBA8803]|nr:FAD-dependent monooxygenase [Cyanobacteria bacterium UBA9273]HBL59040.1 FAD-dependent monooxygenase [Cyanobacteria bacterium UBA8803]